MINCNPAQDFEALLLLIGSFGIKDIVISALGTFVGAFVAFRLQSRSEFRKLVLQESSSINSAFAVVYSYVNTAENMKRQVLPDKRNELETLTNAAVNAHIALREGNENVEVVAVMHHTLSTLNPISFLRGEVVSSIGSLRYIAGRPQIFGHELEKCAAMLNSLIQSHNQTIEKIKSQQGDEAKIFMIAGLTRDDRTTDESYRHSVEHMDITLQDIIFFGSAILSELEKYHTYWKKFDKSRNLKFMSRSDEWKIETQELSQKPIYKTWEHVSSTYSRPV